MLHVIILILKAIGLLLLVLLGFLLTALLLLLFAPVRYRADGSFDETPSGKASVSWLLHLVSAVATFDGKAVLSLRVLCFPVWKKQLWPEGESEDDGFGGPEEEDDGILLHTTELSDSEPVEEPPEEPQPEKIPEHPDESERTPEHGKKPERFPKTGGNQGKGGAERTKNRRVPLWKRLQDFIKGILRRFRLLCGRLRSWKASLEKGKAFFQDEENQKTIKLLMKQTKKLFRQLLPRKIRGRIRFGFDDPYDTGRILTAVSPFYALYAKSLVLEPVFDERVLEGELHVKGHIRAAAVLWIGVRIWLNKNFRELVKKWR